MKSPCIDLSSDNRARSFFHKGEKAPFRRSFIRGAPISWLAVCISARLLKAAWLLCSSRSQLSACLASPFLARLLISAVSVRRQTRRITHALTLRCDRRLLPALDSFFLPLLKGLFTPTPQLTTACDDIRLNFASCI